MLRNAAFSPIKHLWEALTHYTNKPANDEVTLDQYRGLFEQTHDAVLIIDLQGHYLHANRRASELLGYSLEEIRKLSLADVSLELSESQSVLKRLLAGEV